MRTRLVSCLLATLLAPVAGAVPMELVHQGRLLDSVGAALDGDHDITFTIYDAATGGSDLWSETLTLSFDAGYFSATLGGDASNALDDALFDGSSRFLALAVDSSAELAQRQALVSVPYAVRAGSAENVSGGTVDATEILVNGTTVIDADGVAWSALADVPAALDALGALSCVDGDALRWDAAGSTWGCADAADHVHDAADLVDGTIAIERLPVGTSAGTLAVGDHTHGSLADLTVTGTLTAEGGVKLGTPTTCDGDAEGTVRYSAGALEFCDGTAWTAVGGDGDAQAMVDAALEPESGQEGVTALYHFALRVPGAYEQDTSALGGNGMLMCAPLTDDNEPGAIGTYHVGDDQYAGAYITGFSSDVNGHCLSGHPAYNDSGPCVSLLVTNWAPSSHEGFGAWCRTKAPSSTDGSVVWAQINISQGRFWSSSGISEAGITKPVKVGDITCSSSGSGCVKRVR